MTNIEASKNITAYVYMECENIPCDVIKALDMAKSALNKQILKKPVCIEDKMWTCPCCYNNLMFKYSRYPDILMPKEAGGHYCMNCGQAIDWGESDG